MDNILKNAYDALKNWRNNVTVDQFVKDNKRLNSNTNPNSPKVSEVLLQRRRHNYEVGQLYILISNNKENLSVAEYLGENEFKNFSMPIFRDVQTNEKCFALSKCIVYTEKRLKALSKLDWDEVVSLMYFQNEEYDMDTAPEVGEYIDPMLNYENIMNALNVENK